MIHGRSNLGSFGNTEVQSNVTDGIGGKFQITTAPPHPGHQITGTIVELSSLVVVIHVFVVIPLDVISSVDTPVGTVVIVEVTAGVPDAVLEDVEVMDSSVVGIGKVVVLPSMFKIPDEPKDTDREPLVNAEPPGVIVVGPMMIPDPLPDAIMLGARVIAVLDEVPTIVGTVDASVTVPGEESDEVSELSSDAEVGCSEEELEVVASVWSRPGAVMFWNREELSLEMTLLEI